MPVAANQAAEIPTPVVFVSQRRPHAAARPKHLAVQGQVRPLQWSLLGTNDVLPAPSREEAMVGTGGQLGAVLELHDICGLHARPLVEDLRDDESAIGTDAGGSVDRLAHLDLGYRLRASIGHQDPRPRTDTVSAGMTATPVGVDSPAKGHARPMPRPGLEALRLRVHFPNDVKDRLVAAYFVNDVQR